jgi:NitT/TauT family transport system substrate-binding protein
MGRRWSSRGLFVFLVSFTLFAMVSADLIAAPGKPEVSKLTVGLPVPAVSFLPLWVADEKGFLRDEGITEVRVLGFRGDADVVQALAAGSVDVNVASLTGLITTIDSGQKFRAVWAGYNMPFFEWYALPRFKSILETKGGRYAVSKFGALTDSLTRYALRTAGLDPEKDVKILQLGGSTQALAAMEAGQIDASILSCPQTYMAAEKGFIKLMSQKEQIGPDWPTHVVYTREDLIARHPNRIKAFLRATGRAIEWIKANPDEAAKVVNKQMKFKVEYCRKAIDEIQDRWFSDGRLPQKGLKVFWDIAVQAGDVKEAWPDGRWLDPSFLKTQSEWRR